MITATILGVLLVPAFFVLIEKRKKKTVKEIPPEGTTPV
jgi:hypothetical protein